DQRPKRRAHSQHPRGRPLLDRDGRGAGGHHQWAAKPQGRARRRGCTDAAEQMTAVTSPLGQGSYSTLPPSLTAKLAKWLHWPAAAAAIVAALYLVFAIYATGQTAWAAGVLVLFAAFFYVYLSKGGFAWRYLFPGVAGMLIFIAFPLV